MLEQQTSRTASAHQAARELLLVERAGGHWIGELSSSALATATAISALSFFVEASGSNSAQYDVARQQIDRGLNWLVEQQNQDGGWGDTTKSYSNISTTMLCIAAISASGRDTEHTSVLERASQFVESKNGIQGIRDRYGKDKTFAVPILANCAMAGIVPWSEVAALPFEAACVPQKFYHLMQLPVVSYAIPALVAIGQVKFHFDPPRNPITRFVRSASISRSLAVLEKMQPASGGFLEAVPLTAFVSMALIKSGKQESSVVVQGIKFLLDSFRDLQGDQGTWPIDTNLATWTTTLSVNALFESSEGPNVQNEDWLECLDWILSCQYHEQHPFTGAEPGGWGWSDLSGAVPDSDDTPGALLALSHFYDQSDLGANRRLQIVKAVNLGVDWLLNLQNRDKGWPTFCRGWGKLPFDRSGTDITAHAIRAISLWNDKKGVLKHSPVKINKVIESGFQYLQNQQLADGSWIPLWFGNQDLENEVNPFYGTAKVLMAFRDTGRLNTKSAINGLNWVQQNQNPDGSWGNSIEETSLCTEVMIDASNLESRYGESAVSGVEWICQAVESGSVATSSPIGFYFAKLWYYEKLYPLIFATSALGRAVQVELAID